MEWIWECWRIKINFVKCEEVGLRCTKKVLRSEWWGNNKIILRDWRYPCTMYFVFLKFVIDTRTNLNTVRSSKRCFASSVSWVKSDSKASVDMMSLNIRLWKFFHTLYSFHYLLLTIYPKKIFLSCIEWNTSIEPSCFSSFNSQLQLILCSSMH